jgi:tetratricopeptide (TPR) repeat protein
MARSFYRPEPDNPTGSYYHPASETYFAMIQRDGKLYQRRHQIGYQGVETNVDEKQVDYVMGSGNHVRTYLSRSVTGALLELPLASYAEKGGYWAMNPGYDKPDQPNARRKIDSECMFCHTGTSSEAIDCQRCHGPGQRHAETGLRRDIVNPARLAPVRQMEVCMQCHLETTSFPFTHSIFKYGRDPLSYRPGQPLGNFILFFDHPRRDDRIQIVNSAYRLEMSACFRKSPGAMTCTTCHDPHDAQARNYNDTCRGCHAKSHTPSPDCVGCHMPKRRTSDVVHAVMTDHYIQRRKPAGDLLAEIPEPHGPDIVYHGKVLPYYPRPFDDRDELYLAVAQVRNGNNVNEGIARLIAAGDKLNLALPEFWVDLGDGLIKAGRSKEAVARYQEAVRRNPNLLPAWMGLGRAYEKSGEISRAAEAFERATAIAPKDAQPWLELGQIRVKQGKKLEAGAALEQSLRLDREIPETHYALGILRSNANDFCEAIRLQPDYAEAHMNLAILLYPKTGPGESAYHFERALHYRPDYPLAHYNYSLMLNSSGNPAAAMTHLKQAAASPDLAIRDAALRLLAQLESRK